MQSQQTIFEWGRRTPAVPGGKWQFMPAGSGREDWQNGESPFPNPDILRAYRFLNAKGEEIARFTAFAGGMHLLTPRPLPGKGQSGWSPLPTLSGADAVQVGGSHYKDMPIQPWEVMETLLTHDEFVGFLKGNYLKYAMRAGHKGDAAEDAKKAQHYAQKLREVQGNA